jgi:hypothetical protein
MGTICVCEFPQGVNKCDDGYHCDRCGYPLGPHDRRNTFLWRVSPEIWSIFVYRVHGYRSPDKAWDYLRRQFDNIGDYPRPHRPWFSRFRYTAMFFDERE